MSRKASEAWGEPAVSEARWPASLAVILAIVLYAILPPRFILGPQWLIPAFEFAVLLPLSVLAPHRIVEEKKWARIAAVAIIAIINLANLVSLVALIRIILTHSRELSGVQLIVSALAIWTTNVLIFALWYWEMDRGGPDARLRRNHPAPDFLFPQMATPGCAPQHWSPGFVDYLFLAFTNATAFSPTDTLPLTPWAKMLMLAQASSSLLTVVFVAARAVNVLS